MLRVIRIEFADRYEELPMSTHCVVLRRWLCLGGGWLCSGLLFPVLLAAAEGPDYLQEIQPIFQKYCNGCHNDTDHEGNVSLESFASLQQGNSKGPNVLPGDPEGSRLLRLILGTAEPVMPPEGEKRPTDAEVALLREWIAAGAHGPVGNEPLPLKLIVPQIESRTDRRPVTAVDLSANGQWLAVARFGEVQLHRPTAAGWEPAHTLSDFPGKVTAVHFIGEGERLLTAAGIPGVGGVVNLWSVATGEKLLELRGHRDLIYDAELSPDGTTVASCSYDRDIILWDVATGQQRLKLSMHNGAVYDVAFSPDGRFLASASADDTCKVWRVADGERMDTLAQPLKEAYCVAFTPDGRRIVSGGADNNLRVWDFISTDRPRINPMPFARFAHEGAIVNLRFTRDGSRLISVAEDRTIKVWETRTYTELKLWDEQPSVPAGLSVAADGSALVVGRLDGSVEWYSLAGLANVSGQNSRQVNLVTAPPAMSEMHKVTENEPNNTAAEAQFVAIPCEITGKIEGVTHGVPDADCFRFQARAGEEWVLEVNAARSKSPLDSFLEVLTPDGERIEQVVLQAVRDSYFTFRGKDGMQSSDFRLFNWEEMELNEYLYASGEVVKLWLYPRGPDSGFLVYPGTGNRWAYFGTTSFSHALGEPCYIVQPHPPGTKLIPNGLPVFPIYYENDDDSRRQLGSDSRVYFTAPADGEYVVKIRDVRGFQSAAHTYQLTIRPRRPDFQVTLHNANLTVNAGAGKEFRVSVQRFDEFDGPVQIEIGGSLPPGFSVTSPIVIEPGQIEAYGVLSAAADAPAPTAENQALTKLTASATIGGEVVRHEVNSLGEIKLAAAAKVLPRIVAADGSMPESGPLEVTIRPGETIRLRVQVERHGFSGEVKFGNEFSGRNLPHGSYVDNIGLNGLMLLADQNEREFFITAANWLPEQERMFHLVTDVEGGQATNPVRLKVVAP